MVPEEGIEPPTFGLQICRQNVSFQFAAEQIGRFCTDFVEAPGGQV